MKLAPLFLAILLLALPVQAHEGEESTLEQTLEQAVAANSLNSIMAAASIAAILVLVSIYKKEKTERQKLALFLGIAIPVLAATVYTAGGTVYLNLASVSGGPVHWHADFEIWNCGSKLDLIDPEGLLNRVGTPVFHEHGDDRIHVEGVVTDLREASLHRFIEFVGGYHDDSTLIIPTNEGAVEMRNGDSCNGNPGKLQGFLFSVNNPSAAMKTGFVFEQTKIQDIGDYVPAPYSNIPPGNCIIIEFDQEKERTDKICSSYRLAIQKGDLEEEHG